jgi:small subunit ribosomal protein S17e
MGRVRGKTVRKVTIDVLKEYKDKFSADYENNKKELDSLIKTDKRMRNKIAGFITQLAKRKKIEAFIIENSA